MTNQAPLPTYPYIWCAHQGDFLIIGNFRANKKRRRVSNQGGKSMETEGVWSLSPADVILFKQCEVTYLAFMSDLSTFWGGHLWRPGTVVKASFGKKYDFAKRSSTLTIREAGKTLHWTYENGALALWLTSAGQVACPLWAAPASSVQVGFVLSQSFVNLRVGALNSLMWLLRCDRSSAEDQ